MLLAFTKTRNACFNIIQYVEKCNNHITNDHSTYLCVTACEHDTFITERVQCVYHELEDAVSHQRVV